MPIPYYRFASLIERAKGLTAAVCQLGGQLLSTLEKRDGEALALLRNSQEKTLLQMSTLIKQQQVEEAKQGGLALNQSLQSAQKRQSWYKDQIDKGLSSNEIQNIVYMTLATVFNTSATAVRTMASIGYAVPQVGSPFAMTYGGAQLGASLTAASGVLDGLGILANFGAQLNLTMAQYRRRESEWQLQSDLAGYDVAQIQYQIAANAAQQKITARDLEVQQTTLAQNEAMDAFLKNKFSSEELYQWMATRLSVLYFQTYQLALDLSRSVQRAYQYELNSDTSFVNFGYWDGGRRGLLAGEGLMLALNQMEKAYLDGNGRTLEIEKTVSLLQLNPRAVLDLIETGECVFELPEAVQRRLPRPLPAQDQDGGRVHPRRHRPLPEPARHADPAEQPGHRQARPERDQLPAGRQRRQHAGQLGAAQQLVGQPEHRAVARAGRQRHVRGLGRRRPLPALRRHGRGLFLAPEPAPAVESLRLSQHHRRGAAAATPPSTAAPSCARTSRGCPPCAAMPAPISTRWRSAIPTTGSSSCSSRRPARARRCPSHWPTWCRITSTGPC